MIADQLDLLSPVPTRTEVRSRKDEWLDRLRSAMYLRFRGQVVTTDDVWRLIDERPELGAPDGVSHNALGRLFSEWPAASPRGFERSQRDGANRNLLRQWWIS